MLRIVSIAIRALHTNINLTNSLVHKQLPITQCIQQRFFGAFSSTIYNWNNVCHIKQKPILGHIDINNIVPSTLVPTTTSVRTVIKYSRKKGKRKTVKTVLKRFYRLNWGIWIRTLAGRHKKLWKKNGKRRYKLKQHVFCNAKQSTLLDKMVNHYWRRPHYYVDDPYTPYHTREEFPFTRKQPKEY
ncbi:39S ribosomal protein L35, mitochondrial [Apis laboriosa]|uniref:39S ribosomal protein L35, mitochondrial n=1 Tax=Apis laboriosa TaxID=183418 RepID=UPI001CC515A1|nr:39S ribosomal protein L35, mitochondrial [Apis laboriosa]